MSNQWYDICASEDEIAELIDAARDILSTPVSMRDADSIMFLDKLARLRKALEALE